MIAPMEKTTVGPVNGTFPTVTYDYPNQRIRATVIISLSSTPGEYDIAIPGIIIPGPAASTWTVIWTLMPDTGVAAIFGPVDGISIQTMPPAPGVDASGSEGMGSPPIQWQVVFTNNVLDVNTITYKYNILVYDTDGRPLARFNRVDPTIAIVKDPMG